MSTKEDQLQTIDPAALAQVSGGAATPASTSTSNDQVLTALTGILDSIHSLANQRSNGGGFNQQEMLMLVMMMQQRNQQQAVAATSAWPWSQEPIVRYY
jgi:hypothetical protein